MKHLLLHPIIVIGAGAAGFSAALELAERGYTVHLIEKNTLGSGSSGRNPGRMGHGFHYVDIETAKMYLRASIQVQRKYPGFLVGQDLPFNHPLRRGRYFITTNSDHSETDILHTYRQIRDEYIRLINEDSDNEVFGPPENFFRVLEPHEYASYVNSSIVAVGVETAEHLFHWKSFADSIKQKILSHPRITLHEHTEVIEITRGTRNQPRFILRTKKAGEKELREIFQTDYLVNSTWQNIESLNHQIGLNMDPQSRTNRLKTLLVVDLPESLWDSNSMFFCMGPHCMMSNMGDGRAMMTYARVTNMEASNGLNMSKKAGRLLDDGASELEKQTIAQQILHGISHYIPEMSKAIIRDVKFGVVQTKGNSTLADLDDPQNSIHKRSYYGVREEQIGLISNPCIKLFYFVTNAELIADLIADQIRATDIIDQAMHAIECWANRNGFLLTPEIRTTILNNFERANSAHLLTNTVEALINPITDAMALRYNLLCSPPKYSLQHTKISP